MVSNYTNEIAVRYYSNFINKITQDFIDDQPNVNFDFNVVIRTILYNLANNYLSIAVGGAITIKSDSIEEYNECLIKSKPLFDVLNFKLDD